jgi:uncharacterized membrane protein
MMAIETQPKTHWALRALAAAGLVLSLYLFWLAGTTAGAIGCGAASGCRELLDSRWSRWLGIPVSAVAAAVFGSMLVASVVVGRSGSESRRRRAATVMIGGAFLALGAAIWFFVVQALVIGSFCAYCVVIHCCGLAAGGCALSFGRRLLRPLNWLATISAAFVGVGLLISGQLLDPPKAFSIDRAASFLVPGGRFDIIPGHAPTIASPHAEHYIVMLSDYACPHCRQTHAVLQETLARYGGRIGLIVLPTPLDRKCNPTLVDSVPPEPQDCALNRLAVAVWCADRASFPAMDRWLMAAGRARGEDEARLHAAELVGEARLAHAEADPAVDAILKQDSQLYAMIHGGKLPQLLFGATHITGTLADSDELERAIRREWHLSPDESNPKAHE